MACEKLIWARMLHSDQEQYYLNKLDSETCTDAEIGRYYRLMQHHRRLRIEAATELAGCMEETYRVPTTAPATSAEALWFKWKPNPMDDDEFKSSYIKPRPPRCGNWSEKLLKQFSKDSKKVVALSETIKKGIKDLGFELRDDLTFACKICVIEKPRSVREIKKIETRLLGYEPTHPITMIFEPSIMEKVVEKVEGERIKYVDEQIFAHAGSGVDN